MSADIISGSDNLSCESTRVISKYFSQKSSMDESLSDFQDKKKSCTGPKTVSKSKLKPIKKHKRIKGQRDIRTLVKSKKNELVTYTKDFDQICKHSGIDVDSEQLQLAIALSKSLQDSKSDAETETVKPLTSQERSRKIKSTLKEYGFKVPNIVIKKSVKKTKSNKKYKLLVTPDTEKSEIINSKYAEVLKTNPTSGAHCLDECDYNDKEIYNKATNICYNRIKNIEAFYVPNLIEITTHKTLLRDWSEIPGRPVSPELKISNFKFDDYEFTQDELDCILSKPLQVAQDTIQKKYITDCEKETKQGKVKEEIDLAVNSKLHHINHKNNKNIGSLFDNQTSITTNMFRISNKARSKSPDLFDEDECSIVESTKDESQFSVIKTSNMDSKISFMDLTECVGNVNYIQQDIMQSKINLSSEMSKRACGSPIKIDFLVSNCHQDKKGQNNNENADICFKTTDISNEDANAHYEDDEAKQCSGNKAINVININNRIQSKNYISSETVREINDFMEVTECVTSEFNEQNIDLSCYKNDKNPLGESIFMKETLHTQTDGINKKFNSKVNEDAQSNKNLLSTTNCILPEVNSQRIENIDLTQTTDENVKHKEVNVFVKNSVDDINRSENDQQIETVTMDLTQSSNSNDDLPIVQLSGTTGDKSLEDTIVMFDDETTGYNILSKNINMPAFQTSVEVSKCLTESINNISHDQDELIITDVPSNKDNFDVISEDNNYAKSGMSKLDTDNINIDLTQSPKSSTYSYHSCESLGKMNNVSIDYDELYDNMISNKTNEKYCTSASDNLSKTNNTEIMDKECEIINDETILNNIESCTKYQKPVQKEVYSPVQRKEDFDSLSIIDNDEENIRIESKSDSYLPKIKVRNRSKDKETPKENSSSHFTPMKLLDLNDKPIVETPENDQYIIKTDNVTPILDYAVMTTPARNKELEKYGIKPFKRKRAIQLLTYLYNQTHPIVEQCSMDEMPSTSKKLRIDEQGNKTNVNPKQTDFTDESDEKDLDKENNFYIETKQHPDVKEIDCCPEDWVFQTREKAKVPSCRVPLHIAFHNYVSCRNRLQAAILRYEPVNIDIIHKDLIASGYRYNPKELLKFMDKKCITVKTTENNSRNKKI